MAFGDHTLDNIGVDRGSIYCALPQIITGDKECGLESVAFQDIQQLVRVEVWSIVISQSHHIIRDAVVDVVVVGDLSKQRSRVVECSRPCGCDI